MRFSRPLPIAVGVSLVLLTGVANATSTTCTTSTVCAEYINSSSGVAIHGEANTGIGIRGTSNGSTGFYGATRSGAMTLPGVEGESLKQSGVDAAGAFGLTGPVSNAFPAYGVLGYGSSSGVFGSTSNPGNPTGGVTADGIAGVDSGGSVQNGEFSDANAGVLGSSTYGTGVAGLAGTSTVEFPPFGEDFVIGIIGDAESNGASAGALLVSSNAPAIAYNPATKNELDIDTQAYAFSFVNDESGKTYFSVDTAGNIYGKSLETAKGTYARTTGASGVTRLSYAAQTTMPALEDFGEGQLVNGHGYVRLDPALADVIDNRNAYHVFLTPEGESDVLYVTQKSPAGFMVREARSGHATIAFEYRILAKPIDNDAQRLAIAPPIPHEGRLDRHVAVRSAVPAEPLDPFVRLRRKLGPAAYARMLEAAQKAETAP